MRFALYPLESIATIQSEIDVFVRTGAIDGRAHGVFIALIAGLAQGFVEVSGPVGGTCHVESWYVRPEARRSGIGRGLIQECEGWARSRGAKVLTSDTNEDYPDSPPAHRACGFGSSEDETRFVKSLADQS